MITQENLLKKGHTVKADCERRYNALTNHSPFFTFLVTGKEQTSHQNLVISCEKFWSGRSLLK